MTSSYLPGRGPGFAPSRTSWMGWNQCYNQCPEPSGRRRHRWSSVWANTSSLEVVIYNEYELFPRSRSNSLFSPCSFGIKITFDLKWEKHLVIPSKLQSQKPHSISQFTNSKFTTKVKRSWNIPPQHALVFKTSKMSLFCRKFPWVKTNFLIFFGKFTVFTLSGELNIHFLYFPCTEAAVVADWLVKNGLSGSGFTDLWRIVVGYFTVSWFVVRVGYDKRHFCHVMNQHV